VNNAQASFDAATKAYNIAVADRDNAQDRFRIAENALKAAQENLNLAITEQGNAQKNLVNARAAVADAQKRFAEAQIAVSAAEDKLVGAQDQLRNAQEKLRTAQTAKDAAQNEYKRAFADLEDARGDLEAAKRRKELADLAVVQAKDALSIVQQARDDSVAALNAADFALKAAEVKLNKVLDKLAGVRSLYVAAKTELGTAQWNYETALNKLYVAQARKETADRASAIALAQGSLSDHNTGYASTTIGSNGAISGTFGGCEAQAHPPISGTVRIVQKFTNGYKVSTGHQILYGPCTKHTLCNVGDNIVYSGYMVNGIVNAQRIERVLLS
jgi:chromosome segregation ATPase